MTLALKAMTLNAYCPLPVNNTINYMILFQVFGMDNLSGAILWKYYEPNLDTEGVVVFTRRTARHPPHDAYLTVVGKHEVSQYLVHNRHQSIVDH